MYRAPSPIQRRRCQKSKKTRFAYMKFIAISRSAYKFNLPIKSQPIQIKERARFGQKSSIQNELNLYSILDLRQNGYSNLCMEINVHRRPLRTRDNVRVQVFPCQFRSFCSNRQQRLL